MRLKSAALAAAFCFVLVALAPAADAESDGGYLSQLDTNGLEVYDQVTAAFADARESPQGTMEFAVSLPLPVLCESSEDAAEYATKTVGAALTAIYCTDPLAIWLWDLPVTGVQVDAETRTAVVSLPQSSVHYDQGYFMAVKVTFSVSVPEDMADDPETEANEIAGYIDAVEEAMAWEASGSDTASKVRSIANHLRRTTVSGDVEGQVSNVYDALVSRSSSSAGTAMAFNALCISNGITSATVSGTVYTSFDEDGTSTGYWNVVREGDRWYACDVTWYNGDDRSVLMAGQTTELSSGFAGERFGSTHVAVDGAIASPQVSAEGYEWPDDRTFFEKYGTHLMATVIVAVIVGVIVYAIRSGNI